MDRATATSTEPPDEQANRHGPRGHLHRIGPLVVLAVGVGALVGAVGLSLGTLTDPGPGLWPFVVALLLTGTGLVLLVVDDPADYERWTSGTARIAGGLAGLAVFVVAFDAIGFLLPAFLMLLLWLRFFGRESWRWSLGLAIAGSVGLYVLFDELLGVPFPDDVVAGLVGR
jgi:putative tricarboxylic transport membrane protein